MTLVLVAGMHRSGTSLAAFLLEAVGFDLGNTDSMLPADEANPNGFAEQWPVVRLNEHLLESFGGSWDNPPDLPEGWWHHRIARATAQRGREAIAEVFDGRPDGLRTCKDPRFSLTLPYWLDLVEVDRIVHVVRDPAAVAASLATRDGIAGEAAGLLWLRYACAAAEAAPDAILVHHEDLLRDPAASMLDLCAALGLRGPDDAARARIGSLVDPSLWRERTTTAQHPTVALAQRVLAGLTGPDPVRRLVTGLAEASGTRHRAVADDLDRTRAEHEEARERAASLQRELDAVLTSRAWRLGTRITALPAAVRRSLARSGPDAP